MFRVSNNAINKWKFIIFCLFFFFLFVSGLLCSALFRFILVKSPLFLVFFSLTFLPSFSFSLLSILLPFLCAFPFSFSPLRFRVHSNEKKGSDFAGLTPLNERRSVVVQVPERVCTLVSNRWTRTSVAVAGEGRKRFGSHYVRRRGGGRGVRSSQVPLETGVVSDRPSRRAELSAALRSFASR